MSPFFVVAVLLAAPAGGDSALGRDTTAIHGPREVAESLARDVRKHDINWFFVGRFLSWSPDSADRRGSRVTCGVDSVLFGGPPDSVTFSRAVAPSFAPGTLTRGTKVLVWMKVGCTWRGPCGDFLVIEADGLLSSDHANANQGLVPKVEPSPLRMIDILLALRFMRDYSR